jgi:hypothetical protein
MRVRKSGGGSHPYADRATPPRWGSSPARVLDPRRGSSPPAGRKDEANEEKEIDGRRGWLSRRSGGRASGSWIWEWGWRELSFIGNTMCKKGRSIDWCDLEHWTQKEIFKDSKHLLHINVIHLIAFEYVDLITRWFFPYLIFPCFPFLANYLWMTWIPLTKWRGNCFLSTSNHAMILSLFFLSLMCHYSDQ